MRYRKKMVYEVGGPWFLPDAVITDSPDIPVSRNAGWDSIVACGSDDAFYNSESGFSNIGTLYLTCGIADAASR